MTPVMRSTSAWTVLRSARTSAGSPSFRSSSCTWPEMELSGLPSSCAMVPASWPRAASRSLAVRSRRAATSRSFSSVRSRFLRARSAVACSMRSVSSWLKPRMRPEHRVEAAGQPVELVAGAERGRGVEPAALDLGHGAGQLPDGPADEAPDEELRRQDEDEGAGQGDDREDLGLRGGQAVGFVERRLEGQRGAGAAGVPGHGDHPEAAVGALVEAGHGLAGDIDVALARLLLRPIGPLGEVVDGVGGGVLHHELGAGDAVVAADELREALLGGGQVEGTVGGELLDERATGLERALPDLVLDRSFGHAAHPPGSRCRGSRPGWPRRRRSA